MDMWAIGCLFYELLTLKVLFAGKSEIDQLYKINTCLGTPNDYIKLKLYKNSSTEFTFKENLIGYGFEN